MRLDRSPLAFVAIVGVLLIAGPALADDVPSPKRDRAQRQEFCKQNPQKCEEQRARMKQRRDEFRAKCEADPAWCEQKKKKKKRRERFHERHGTGPASEGAPQPPE
ncbi:MAG: hypothetical protein FJ108_03850 [Deltaproteobacteria bacterium]|nr:hypothetical protein [Deltaproteobacteria bacterium]